MSSQSVTKIVIVILHVISLPIILISGLAIFDFILHSDEYRFGTEVHGWVYYSPLNYIIFFASIFLILMVRFFVKNFALSVVLFLVCLLPIVLHSLSG